MAAWLYDSLFGDVASEAPPPSLFDRAFSDPASLLPKTVCEADQLLADFLGELTLTASEELPEVRAAALAASITTLATAGSVLCFGRIVGGHGWILSTLYLVAGLVGGAGMSTLLKSSTGSSLAEGALAAAGLSGELKCAARIAVVLLAALTASSTAARLVGIAFFSAGALLAGYGAHVACVALEPIVAESLAPTPVPPHAALLVATLFALLGGYQLVRVGPALLDTSLSALGAGLLAHAALSYYHANEAAFLPQAAPLRVREFASAYALAIALALLIVRGALLGVRAALFSGTGGGGSDPLIGR